MTLEEAQAKIKELESTLETSNSKITKLNGENAEKRILNNQQKKQVFAMKKVISSNNIKVDYDTLGTDSLTLNKETGMVEGEVSYNPASSVEVGGGVPPVSNGAPEAMSIESIQGMNRTDIANNWEAVAEVLANQPQ